MKTGAPVLDSFIDDFRGFESLFTGPGFIQRNYKKESLLNDETNYGKWQYYIVRGFVEAVYPDEEGTNHMLFQKPKGSIVPLNYSEPACLTYSENIYLRAIEDTRVIEFSTELLRRLIHSHPDFALKCLEHKDKDVNLSYYRVLTLLLPDSFKKVCRLLNDFYNGKYFLEGDTISFPLGRMADGLHLSRMQLYRVLQNLQNQGIIETNREKIRILNKTALYDLSR